jgi:hypothetical protein
MKSSGETFEKLAFEKVKFEYFLEVALAIVLRKGERIDLGDFRYKLG